MLATALEELHRAFMLLRRGSCAERAEVATFAGFWILLARIESVLTVLELSNHRGLGPRMTSRKSRRESARCPQNAALNCRRLLKGAQQRARGCPSRRSNAMNSLNIAPDSCSC